jgi:hypothetical protein
MLLRVPGSCRGNNELRLPLFVKPPYDVLALIEFL